MRRQSGENASSELPCEWGYWWLDSIAGAETHCVALLYCLSGHLHDALLSPNYSDILRMMRACEFQAYFPGEPASFMDDFDREFPPLLVYDFARGSLDWPDGRRWPMRPADSPPSP